MGFNRLILNSIDLAAKTATPRGWLGFLFAGPGATSSFAITPGEYGEAAFFKVRIVE